MWDIIVLSTYLILSIVYLWAYRREDEGKMSHTAIRVISIIALVVAVGVHTVTAWIFSLSAAHEFWHTALMGPWFVASALDCGTALVLVVVIALQKAGRLSIERSSMVNLAKMLAVFTCVDLYFFACDLLTSGFPGGEGADVVAMLVTGPLAPFFWTQIACMVLACVILFVPRLRTKGGVVVASALVIAGVFCKRCQILMGGFQIPNIEFADVANQMTITHWDSGMSLLGYQGLVYWPTPLEFGVAAGVVALGGFLLLLGLKYLPLHLKEKTA
jgi:molybdopterin-containing oxidoreductase family membrane subunit